MNPEQYILDNLKRLKELQVVDVRLQQSNTHPALVPATPGFVRVSYKGHVATDEALEENRPYEWVSLEFVAADPITVDLIYNPSGIFHAASLTTPHNKLTAYPDWEEDRTTGARSIMDQVALHLFWEGYKKRFLENLVIVAEVF